MKRMLVIAAMTLAFGCDGGETSPEDGGSTPGVDSGTTPGVDAGTTPGTDAGSDAGTTPSTGWALRSHPCVGNRTDALHRDDDGTLYVGCGSTTTGLGLFVSTNDGASWDEPTTTPNGFFDTWRVLDVSRSADDLLYVAGIDTASSRRVVSADTSGGSWALEEVYNAGSTVGTAFTVGTFRRQADGRAVAESLNGTDIQARASDTDDWQDVSSWGEDFGGLQILDLEMYNGEFYGVGSTISQPPYLFLPQTSGTGFGFRVIRLSPEGIGSYRGEMWGVAVDEGGIVAGGVNQDRDVGMIYALDDATSTTLRTFDVSLLFPDDATWIRGVCRRGETLYAVGELTAEAEGLVLRSENNGGTWANVTPDTGNPADPFPPVHRCLVAGDDRVFIAGADGMLAVSN